MNLFSASFTSEAFSNWTKWPQSSAKICKSFANGRVLSTWKLAMPFLSSVAVIKRTGFEICAAGAGIAFSWHGQLGFHLSMAR